MSVPGYRRGTFKPFAREPWPHCRGVVHAPSHAGLQAAAATILGAAPSELRPIDRIAMAGTPILIASGTVDAYSPLSEAKTLFDQAAEPKQFWAVAGAAHVDLEQYDPTQYWTVILPFLNRYVKLGDPAHKGIDAP